MLQAKFQDHRTSCSGEDDFKGFNHIYAWPPSWSCDLYHFYKLSFPLPKKAQHEIWHWLAKRFQRRRLKIMVIYMYNIDPGQGQTTPWGQFLFIYQYSPLLQVFFQ